MFYGRQQQINEQAAIGWSHRYTQACLIQCLFIVVEKATLEIKWIYLNYSEFKCVNLVLFEITHVENL